MFITDYMESDANPSRKRPAHLASQERRNRASIQFITVCTKERKPVLNSVEVNDLVQSIWMDDSVFRVERYVIMPDHIHLFCAPNRYPPEPLKTWVRFWKSKVATHFPGATIGKLWQRDFWDRELRSGESYSEKWHYVRNNPVRAGYVEKPEKWPYQGEMYPLTWHD